MSALLALACLGWVPSHADPAGEALREWRFQVLLDGKDIGRHVFRLREAGGRRVLESEARFSVRILFFEAYRYEHEAREVWEQGCLASVDARTFDNGTESRVRGQRNSMGFALDNAEASVRLPDCVMSFAYWNPAFLGQGRLLNLQTGDYLAVTVRELESPDPAAGADPGTRRFRLTAEGVDMELWYSPELDWLALESTTEGGRRLRYQRL